MTSGKLGAADLAANIDVRLYVVPESVVTTLSVRLCNRNASQVKLRVAVGTGTAPAEADYLEYDTPVPEYGILDNSGIVMSAGEQLWVRSTAANVSARAHGFEESV